VTRRRYSTQSMVDHTSLIRTRTLARNSATGTESQPHCLGVRGDRQHRDDGQLALVRPIPPEDPPRRRGAGGGDLLDLLPVEIAPPASALPASVSGSTAARDRDDPGRRTRSPAYRTCCAPRLVTPVGSPRPGPAPGTAPRVGARVPPAHQHHPLRRSQPATTKDPYESDVHPISADARRPAPRSRRAGRRWPTAAGPRYGMPTRRRCR
jgi:hypothetical protein